MTVAPESPEEAVWSQLLVANGSLLRIVTYAKLWAYPTTMVVLGLFIVYQLYRYMETALSEQMHRLVRSRG